MANNEDLVISTSDQVRESFDGSFAIGNDLMVINVGDDILTRQAIAETRHGRCDSESSRTRTSS